MGQNDTRTETIEDLPNCWEIKRCGREPGGRHAEKLGVCEAAAKGMGHSCWAVAGDLMGGSRGCLSAHKGCLVCEVYLRYNRTLGPDGARVSRERADEDKLYRAVLHRARG